MSLKTKSDGSNPFLAASDDPDTGIGRPSANTVDVICGGSTVARFNSSGLTLTGALTVPSTGSYRTPQTYTGALVSSIAGSTTAGGFFRASNPFGADVLVMNAIVNLGTAASSGTATVDFGIASASNGSSDNLFDGLTITTAGVFQNDVDFQGTNGKTSQKWGSSQWLTGTVASGNVSAAVGSIYVTVIPA